MSKSSRWFPFERLVLIEVKMRNHWKDLLLVAAPFIEYLQRDSFFEKQFGGDRSDKLVIKDEIIGFKYASDDSLENFDDWEAVSESIDIFPLDFEWSSWVDHNLMKNNFFDLMSKNFHGADVKWTQGGVCLLHELMLRDIRIILNCYSNDYFPGVWRDILGAYLNDGFPCGWDGRHPEGKIVVFSNY